MLFLKFQSLFLLILCLGRPWLYLARAKDDWGKGTLTIGKGINKIVLSMYPTKYHGETQEKDIEVTTSNSYGSESNLQK
jgi:hypothetical protein